MKDKLIKAIREVPISQTYEEYVNALADRLSADVVEVVRCKDCIYYKSNCCFNRQWDFESSVEVPFVRENDFCSYGERSENVNT